MDPGISVRLIRALVHLEAGLANMVLGQKDHADTDRMVPVEPPLLSVRLITYQHEPFISEAIEGVLSQRTRFRFELVIGDDASTDGTRSICQRYQERWPDTIRLLPSACHRGMAGNHLAALEACRGEYVALCDGDDYWIDPGKLQRQVDFLEEHRECVLCFHDAFSEYEDGRRERWMKRPWNPSYDAPALFREWLITTSSLLFRNPRLDAYPRYMQLATHEDLALLLYLADRGRIGYLDRVMSVYRRHAAGVMTSYSGIEFARQEIAFLGEMDAWFGGKYGKPIRERIAGLHRYVAKLLAIGGYRREALHELGISARHAKPPGLSVIKDAARILGFVALPARARAALLRMVAARRAAREPPH
jgi:glycosyltransferase involved in cell wall biosynthesis